jgi:hypothetical protein
MNEGPAQNGQVRTPFCNRLLTLSGCLCAPVKSRKREPRSRLTFRGVVSSYR